VHVLYQTLDRWERPRSSPDYGDAVSEISKILRIARLTSGRGG
jgi:hypothetical protein